MKYALKNGAHEHPSTTHVVTVERFGDRSVFHNMLSA